MDGLSSAASIIAVIQITSTLISLGNDYISVVKRASDDIRDLTQELVALKQVLVILQDYASRNPQSIAFQKLSVKDGPLQKCTVELSRLRLKLEPKTGLKGMIKSLTWPFNQTETMQNIARIERHKSLFSLALAADHISLSHAIKAYTQDTDAAVQEIKKDFKDTAAGIQNLETASTVIGPCVENTNTTVEEIKADVKDAGSSIQDLKTESTAQALQRKQDEILRIEAKRMKALKWLYPDAFDIKHLDISHRRQQGTGKWLPKTSEFQRLVEGRQDPPLLWGYGIPGVGKTFLSSVAVDYLLDEAPTANYGVAYIYFDYQEQEQQKPIAVLSSLVKQIASQLQHLPTKIEELYDNLERKDKRPSLEELYTTLVITSKSFSRVFLVFDALDECEQKVQRKELLPLFHRMGKDGISLFLTSRQHPEDIQESFSGVTKIELTAEEKDIQSYIRARIEENPRAKRLVQQGGCEERIISELIDCAKGMFLLVKFHVEYLCEQPNARKVLNALEKLKTASTEKAPLDPTYDRVMKTIRNKPEDCTELAIKILSWLVKARRPLTIDEIQAAVAVEPGRYGLDRLDLTDKSMLLDVCAGLITIDENSSTTRLAHYTVQEYLLKNHILPKDADLDLAITCITYLSFDIFAQDVCTSDSELSARRSTYPFLDYAANHLAFHLKFCDETSTTGFVLRFLRNSKSISSYLQALNTIRYSWGFSKYATIDQPPLHVASDLGHCAVVRLLLGEASLASLGSDKQEIISLATSNKHDAIVQLLVEKKADISFRDKTGKTALHRAAFGGHELVVRLLLENGADFSVLDSFQDTALSIAVSNGHEATVKLLLEKGSKFQRSLLHKAASQGHEAVVRILLNHGPDPSFTDGQRHTALREAVPKENEGIVEPLLKNKIDLEAQDQSGRTALHLAMSRGNKIITKPLLNRSIEFTAQGRLEHIALREAISSGDYAKVKLLLSSGADLAVRDWNGCSALHWAISSGDEVIVKLLLDSGVDLGTQNRDGSAALHWAISKGYEAIVKLLINNCIDPSANFECITLRGRVLGEDKAPLRLLLGKGVGLSAEFENAILHEAVSSGHGAMAKLLLRHGADFPTEPEPISLRKIVPGGCDALIRLLVNQGADLSAKFKYATLREAVSGGHVALVKLLLNNGASLKAKDQDGDTVLHDAASRGHDAIVKLLLDNGADPTVKDRDGHTALDLAISKEKGAVIKLLLNSQSNLAAWDRLGHIALREAVSSGNHVVMKLLLENGADLTIKDRDGHTALDLAISKEKGAVIKLLLNSQSNLAAWDRLGYIALREAVSSGKHIVVKLLLENGADFTVKGPDGGTALHDAAGVGHEETVKLLLDNGADLTAKGYNGRTALHCAALSGHQAIVKLLLDNGADLTAKGHNGRTALHYAAFSGHQAVARLLLDNGADLTAKNQDGVTALHDAARGGHEETVKLLLDNGADLTAKVHSGRTALHYAAFSGHQAVARLLLDNGADLTAKNQDGVTALHDAARGGHEETVKLLLDSGADLAAKGHNGRTALHYAAFSRHQAIVRLLLDNGADLTARNQNERTALHDAVRSGHEETVKLLLDNGADLTAKAHDGRTALHYAAFSGHQAIVRLLLNNGADLTAKAHDGRTALHYAAFSRHQAIVKFLLGNGADLTAKDHNGCTALHYAEFNGHQAIVRLLLDHGTDLTVQNEDRYIALDKAALEWEWEQFLSGPDIFNGPIYEQSLIYSDDEHQPSIETIEDSDKQEESGGKRKFIITEDGEVSVPKKKLRQTLSNLEPPGKLSDYYPLSPQVEESQGIVDEESRASDGQARTQPADGHQTHLESTTENSNERKVGEGLGENQQPTATEEEAPKPEKKPQETAPDSEASGKQIDCHPHAPRVQESQVIADEKSDDKETRAQTADGHQPSTENAIESWNQEPGKELGSKRKFFATNKGEENGEEISVSEKKTRYK